NRCSNKSDLIAFENKAGQLTSRVGSRVDIDAVCSNVRLGHRRVPMHDNLAKVLLAGEEIVSNPEQVVFRLLGKANSWSNSSMDEEKITADEILFQAAQELAVVGWKNPVKFRSEFSLVWRISFSL